MDVVGVDGKDVVDPKARVGVMEGWGVLVRSSTVLGEG